MTARPIRPLKSPTRSESARFASSTAAWPRRATQASMPHQTKVKSSRSSTPTRAPIATGCIIWSRRSSAATRPRRPAQISLPIRNLLASPRWLPRPDCRARCVPATIASRNYADATWRLQKPRCRRSAASIRCSPAAGDDVDLSWRLQRRVKRSRTLLEPS